MSATAQVQAGTSLRHAPRNAIGIVLLVAWGIATFMWVGSTIHLASNGEGSAIITAVAALLLLCLLAGMEGLEVAAIDRWKESIAADEASHSLARWLAARQFFVAMVVTTVAILAHRSEVILPGTGVSFDEGTLLYVYDVAWTTLTVLWFAQIFPKHLAATNPDRYLSHLRPTLFPIVEVVNKTGIPKPGAWTALAVERRLNWPLTPAEQMEEAMHPREVSLAHIWRQLTPELTASGAAPESQDASQSDRTVK